MVNRSLILSMPTILNQTAVLLSGTGKICRRLAPRLSAAGYNLILCSRSGSSLSLPNTLGIKFNWFDFETYDGPFTAANRLKFPPISAIFLTTPPTTNAFPLAKQFLNSALKYGVKRIAFLSGTCLEIGDGPVLSQISEYIRRLSINHHLKISYTILRSTWFIENFSEMENHVQSIRNENKIVSAAGKGRAAFVSAGDVAEVVFKCLTSEVGINMELVLLGPELLSLDDVCSMAASLRLLHAC